MLKKEELLAELAGIKNSIRNRNLKIEVVENSLQSIDQSLNRHTLLNSTVKSNIIKSFMITFNVSNFSDLTIIFITNSDNMRIVEYSGSEILFNEFKSLMEAHKNFYKDTGSINVNGSTFSMFYEAMENNKGIYTILTITESVFFKPGKFHMLCDILMDIIRSADMSGKSVFNDLFEDTAIGINSYIASISLNDIEIYLFKFENIYDFFLKMGLEIIIELSETIKKKLKEVFGDKSSIFRFSLSEYIVISPEKSPAGNRYSDLNNSNILDFNYKGIVLKHRCVKIPFSNDQSIYDIFENIFLINNNIPDRNN